MKGFKNLSTLPVKEWNIEEFLSNLVITMLKVKMAKTALQHGLNPGVSVVAQPSAVVQCICMVTKSSSLQTNSDKVVPFQVKAKRLVIVQSVSELI